MNKFDLLLEQMTDLKILSVNEKAVFKTKTKELEWEIKIFPESMILIPAILEKSSKAILDDCGRGRIPPDYDNLIVDIFKLIGLDAKQPTYNLNYQKNDNGKTSTGLV